MRISGGKARGIPLRSSKTKGLRPATEANRERLFSSIQNKVEDQRVLDLFAGTGSYGLEAISRGAKTADFVEKNHRVVGDLKQNLTKVIHSAQFESSVGRVYKRDVLEFLNTPTIHTYDIIFLDPPYSEIDKLVHPTLEKLINNGFVHSRSLLFHECPAGQFETNERWNLVRLLGKAKKGSPVYHIFEPKSFAVS